MYESCSIAFQVSSAPRKRTWTPGEISIIDWEGRGGGGGMDGENSDTEGILRVEEELCLELLFHKSSLEPSLLSSVPLKDGAPDGWGVQTDRGTPRGECDSARLACLAVSIES